MKKATTIFAIFFITAITMIGCAPIVDDQIQEKPQIEKPVAPEKPALLRFVDHKGERELRILTIEKEYLRGTFEEGPVGKDPEFFGNFNYSRTPWTGTGDYENDGFFTRNINKGMDCADGVGNTEMTFYDPLGPVVNGKMTLLTTYKGDIKKQFRDLFGF